MEWVEWWLWESGLTDKQRLRDILITASQNCARVSPVMDTLTQVGVIFRGVQDVAGPWKEMKIIYRKSRTAEHASSSVIISHVHVQARSSLLIIVWKIVLLVPACA